MQFIPFKMRILFAFLFIGSVSACNFDRLMPKKPTAILAGAVGTRVAETVAAQTPVNNPAMTTIPTETLEATPTPTATLAAAKMAASEPTAVNIVETQAAETAVSLTSTQTANTHALQTRTAHDVATAEAAYVVPELRSITDNANVRNGPGTHYPAIGSLRLNQTVPVTAKNRVGDWFLIEMQGGYKGWVHYSVTTPVSAQAMAQIGVAATIPAPPSPTPTATYTPTPVESTSIPAPVYTDGTLYAINAGFDDVCFLYITPEGSDALGGDRLGADVLEPGNTLAITLESGWYYLLAEDCNGIQTEPYHVYITAGDSYNWDIYIDSWEPPSLTVYNWLEETVCFLYISPTSSSEWGGDWLGDYVLEPYSSMTFYPDEDSYDLRATDCDGFDLDIAGPVYISGESYWDIGE
jgi:hypothetical protein